MASGTKSFSFKRLLAKLPRGRASQAPPHYRLVASAHSERPRPSRAQRGGSPILAAGLTCCPATRSPAKVAWHFLVIAYPAFHVGGKTALAWRGIRQNVSFREVLTLWEYINRSYCGLVHTTFREPLPGDPTIRAKLRKGFGLQPLPNGRPEVLVSVPERALLELLSDVGKAQSSRGKHGNSSKACARCAKRPLTSS